VPVREIFFPPHVLQTGSGVLAAFYSIYSGNAFPGIQRPERESGNSPPTNPEAQNRYTVPNSPHDLVLIS
jgi:hypothetical protein